MIVLTVFSVLSFPFRYGRRPVLLLAMVGMVPARLLISLAPNYYVYMIGYMLAGGLNIAMYLVSFVLGKSSLYSHERNVFWSINGYFHLM